MSRYADMDHAGWIESSTKQKCSPIGRRAAYILGVTFGGIYNTPMNHNKTDWTNEHHTEAVVSHRSLATFDFDELTLLVLLAHRLCVRVQINAVAPNRMRLFFSQRARDGGMARRHPTISDAAGEFDKWLDDDAVALATDDQRRVDRPAG